MLLAQRSERVEIADVERIECNQAGPAQRARLFGLDQHRPPGKPGVVHDPTERLEAEAAIADVLVPIDAAAAWPLRVVGVKHPEPIEPDEPIEGGERVRDIPPR